MVHAGTITRFIWDEKVQAAQYQKAITDDLLAIHALTA